MAYFLVDGEDVILEGNRAAAVLVGIDQNILDPCGLHSDITSSSMFTLRVLLNQLAMAGGNKRCTLFFQDQPGNSHQRQVMVSCTPVSDYFLLACGPVGTTGLV